MSSMSESAASTDEIAAGPVRTKPMALPFGETPGARDSRALSILAKTIYRELRSSGYEARDVMALAGELLEHVAIEVRSNSPGATAAARVRK
jgi:hypothetical protein